MYRWLRATSGYMQLDVKLIIQYQLCFGPVFLILYQVDAKELDDYWCLMYSEDMKKGYLVLCKQNVLCTVFQVYKYASTKLSFSSNIGANRMCL